MKSVRSLIFAIGLIGLSGAAICQGSRSLDDSSRAAAQRLAEQTGLRENLRAMLVQMLPAANLMFERTLALTAIPESARRQIVPVFQQNFAAEMQSEAVLASLLEAAVTMLVSEYTLEEMQILSQFYATPLGQKTIARAVPQFQAMTEIGQRIGEAAGRRAAARTLQQLGIARPQ